MFPFPDDDCDSSVKNAVAVLEFMGIAEAEVIHVSIKPGTKLITALDLSRKYAKALDVDVMFEFNGVSYYCTKERTKYGRSADMGE